MLDGIAGELIPKQEHYMQHISNSGHHLLTLINDILDISKIEAGKMDLRFDMVDVKTIIDETVTMTQTLTSEKKIIVGIELPENMPKILADKSKLKQIMYNLIGNAIKFTDDDGKIKIRAEINEKIIRISVIDTGIGISLKDQKKLFKPFSQIDSSISRKYEGTGLGLALVKELIESHGGKIWVESEPGKGSNFTFEIPIDQTGRTDND
jgi:signal transduction histidine kinase